MLLFAFGLSFYRLSTLEQADAFLEGIAIECQKENDSLAV